MINARISLRSFQDLMQENQVLRQLLKSLSGFIGDGAGGLLPKLGWDLNDFNNFVNRSETDTAWESYQRHKREEPTPGGNSAGPSNANKRPSDEDASSSRNKRPRSTGEQDAERDGYPMLVSVNSAVPTLPPNGMYTAAPPPPSARSHESNLFNDLMRGPGGSPLFASPTSPPTNQYNGSPATGVTNNVYPTSYMPSMNVNVESSLPGIPMVAAPVTMPTSRVANNSQSASKASAPPPNPADDDQDPKRHEAYKLIQ